MLQRTSTCVQTHRAAAGTTALQSGFACEMGGTPVNTPEPASIAYTSAPLFWARVCSSARDCSFRTAKQSPSSFLEIGGELPPTVPQRFNGPRSMSEIDVPEEIRARLSPITNKYFARGWQRITIKRRQHTNCHKPRVFLYATSPRGTHVHEIFDEDDQLAESVDAFLSRF